MTVSIECGVGNQEFAELMLGASEHLRAQTQHKTLVGLLMARCVRATYRMPVCL